MLNFVIDFGKEFIIILGEMAPYLLLGFFIAGLLHTLFPTQTIQKYFGGNSFRSSMNAAIFGIPLPLCSCGVIPTGMSFYKNAEMISPIGFDSTGAFTAGFARVRNYVKGGTFDGIMDKTGKIVLVLSNPMASSEANGSKSLNLSFTSQMFPYSSRADNRLLQRR